MSHYQIETIEATTYSDCELPISATITQARTIELIQKNFWHWYNNKDIVPTFEAMQRMVAVYHDKDIDMLNLGRTLQNLTKFCLHKPTDAKFYRFTVGAKDLSEKIQKEVVGGASIVSTRNAIFDETFIGKSTNICNSILLCADSQI